MVSESVVNELVVNEFVVNELFVSGAVGGAPCADEALLVTLVTLVTLVKLVKFVRKIVLFSDTLFPDTLAGIIVVFVVSVVFSAVFSAGVGSRDTFAVTLSGNISGNISGKRVLFSEELIPRRVLFSEVFSEVLSAPIDIIAAPLNWLDEAKLCLIKVIILNLTSNSAPILFPATW